MLNQCARPFAVFTLVACQILVAAAAAAAETGTVAAYNVKQPNSIGCATALGNGVNDDTSAIQCMLTAAGAAGGGIVFLPQGTYRTSAALTVPSFVTLQGAGSGSILKPFNGANILQGVIELSNSSTPVSFATVRDLHIDGNGTNLTVLVAGVGLDYGANHNTITNLVIENTRAEGIGLYISNSSLMNDYNLISGNTLHDNGAGTGCGQMIVWGGRYNRIVNNTIYKSGAPRTGLNWGILFNVNNTSLAIQHNVLHGNVISNTGYAGIWMKQDQCSGCTTQIAWNEVSGNVVKDNVNWGILTQVGAGHNTFSSNTVTGNGLDGILIQTNGNTITDNVVSDNLRNGIALDSSGATDNVIVGNVSQNVTTTSQQRGIIEQNTGPDFNLIAGNNGRGNAFTPGVVKAGANTILVNNQGQ